MLVSTTPLLTDGANTKLLSFRVPTTEKKKTLKFVDFALTGSANIDEISLDRAKS